MHADEDVRRFDCWVAHGDPKVEAFRNKIRTDHANVGLADPYAEFFDDDLRAVRCSRCKLTLHMEKLNHVKDWN